jgi:hypothetical protein
MTFGNKTVLAVDLGYGSTKVCYKQGTRLKYFKKVSAVAEVPSIDHVTDENAFPFNGKQYYLFDTALKLPSTSLIDMMTFDGFKKASPIILRYLIHKLDIEPDLIVIGLSIAQIQHSGVYQRYVADTLQIDVNKILVVPQGAGAKVTYDTYYLEPSKAPDERVNTRSFDYLGLDLGFNTVDAFMVLEGAMSAALSEGFPGEGVVKVADRVVSELGKRDYSIDVQDAKSIITTGKLHYRGEIVELNTLVSEIIAAYLKDLIQTVEKRYGAQMNKLSNIVLSGGGAQVLMKHKNAVEEILRKYYTPGFLEISEQGEYCNAIGYYHIGSKMLLDD